MWRFLSIIVLAVAGLTAPGIHAQTVTFRVCLDGGQVVPPTGSNGTGSATVVLNTTTRNVSVTGSYGNLATGQTGVHIHGNADVGANGGQIVSLTGMGGTTGTFSGSTVFSPAQVQDMLSGLHYIDIHTAGAPAGEIRGQVLQAMNVDCPAALPTDPVLVDTSGHPDFGPMLGDPVEAFNVSLDCSNAGAPGIYSMVVRLDKAPVPAATTVGNLWITGPKALKCGGAHARSVVECFANDVVLPNDVSLAGVGYCIQGFCSDPTNRPGRLSNAIYQVVGIGSSTIFQDTFDGTSLDPSWSLHNASLMQFSVSGGELHMQPTTGEPWFQDREGPLIYRNVTGDFTATATMRAEDPNNPGLPPPISFRLGGLIARDPGSVAGDRNSVHVVLGAGSSSFPVAAEDKTTDGSNSNFAFLAIAQPAGEVRIVRQGSLFSLEYRAPGAGSFQVLRAHDRPDLPATLQVGPMVYSNGTPPDVIVHFDQVTITGS